MPWVDVSFLEVCEEELTRGSVIAVGTKDHVRKLKLCCYGEEIV